VDAYESAAGSVCGEALGNLAPARARSLTSCAQRRQVVGIGNASSRVELRRLTGHAVRVDATAAAAAGRLSPAAVQWAALGLLVSLLLVVKGHRQFK
jgi:hypothetical protein